MSTSFRIGAGAGFSNDRLDAALQLVRAGDIDTLTLEVLAERTLALQHIARRAGRVGHWPHAGKALAELLPVCLPRGISVTSNLGGADPRAATACVHDVIARAGLPSTSVGTVTGSDVHPIIRELDPVLLETGQRLGALQADLIAADVYLGADGIRLALEQGARVVVTGRVTDSALALGACAHALGWAPDDWDRIAAGVVAGHLSECAAQITGGYFADPPLKPVDDLAQVGFPILEISADGAILVRKAAGSGGRLDRRTVIEQLLYETHDPSAYLTPDATVDLTEVQVAETPEGVRITGVRGRQPPPTLKALIAVDNGLAVEGGISYAGINAVRRARMAGEILRQRFAKLGIPAADCVFDVIGMDSIFVADTARPSPVEARLHIGLRLDSDRLLADVQTEIEGLYTNGPAGGGGARCHAQSSLRLYSALIDRHAVRAETTLSQR